MGGLGYFLRKEGLCMYKYVEDKEFLFRAKNSCSEDMKALEVLLREEYEINSQFFLVGSGAKNMLTQNANEGIDFDYNLNILSCPDWRDGRYIKESVRKCFNKVMRKQGLSDVEDSKSSLTTKPIHFNDYLKIGFSMDVCIVTNNSDGLWERLIHEKTGYTNDDRYYWNTAPYSKDYQKKAKCIKRFPGWWKCVREMYLKRKNHYLRCNDNNHPSFICYIEVINDVYNMMMQNR